MDSGILKILNRTLLATCILAHGCGGEWRESWCSARGWSLRGAAGSFLSSRRCRCLRAAGATRPSFFVLVHWMKRVATKLSHSLSSTCLQLYASPLSKWSWDFRLKALRIGSEMIFFRKRRWEDFWMTQVHWRHCVAHTLWKAAWNQGNKELFNGFHSALTFKKTAA